MKSRSKRGAGTTALERSWAYATDAEEIMRGMGRRTPHTLKTIDPNSPAGREIAAKALQSLSRK